MFSNWLQCSRIDWVIRDAVEKISECAIAVCKFLIDIRAIYRKVNLKRIQLIRNIKGLILDKVERKNHISNKSKINNSINAIFAPIWNYSTSEDVEEWCDHKISQHQAEYLHPSFYSRRKCRVVKTWLNRWIC